MQEYCNSLTEYSRWKTREVQVGNVGIGGGNPIRIQSMTTANTMDTVAVVAQSMRMIAAGCEIVRLTAPSIREAENLRVIKDELRNQGITTPLVADIHFTPNAAVVAARIVEKVRINPGNYADRKKFETHDYSDQAYDQELQRIRERFLPLVKTCKEEGTAMRIGTNHGSLSDRIVSRFGDTPRGMVESAMEFLRIAEDENYYNIVLSMKASNTQVMVQAYRLLVKTLVTEGMNYPLHLGVTEAGEGEDGRIKSAVGIGTLLEDGLGDTIRVSLTEEPEVEIPVACELVKRYNNRNMHGPIRSMANIPYNPFFRARRKTNQVLNLGHKEVPRVIGNLSKLVKIQHHHLAPFGYLYSQDQDKWHISDQAVDLVYLGAGAMDFPLPGTLAALQDPEQYEKKDRHYPYIPIDQYDPASWGNDQIVFLSVNADDYGKATRNKIKNRADAVVVVSSQNNHAYADLRRWFMYCLTKEIKNPVIVRRQYQNTTPKQFLLYSATDLGGLQVDGFGDGIWLEGEKEYGFVNETAFGILQASRSRISKTDYISCPSCGRTLFDLQETTGKIRARTNHLKGIKIGIMGCIVNGPGEMADADYGYVGTGPGKVSLYKGQDVVARNIPAESAVDALTGLIEQHGDWIEPGDV